MNMFRPILFMVITLAAQASWAGWEEDLANLQHRWESIKYQTPATEHEKKFEQLFKEAQAAQRSYPKQAEIWIWSGIIEASYAGAKGGLGALTHVKNAKSSLERAISWAPEVLDGSAYTSLGSLYYQVPGWPIGFGDDDEAMNMLTKALKINPNGIDANFFMGDFLFKQKKYKDAQNYLQKVLSAATRPGREIADEGRRQEARQLLKSISEKLKS